MPPGKNVAVLIAAICCYCGALNAAPPEGDKPKIWSYSGNSGPEHWAELSPDYSACASGLSQSPVNLSGAADKPIDNVQFHYQPSPLHIINTGKTLMVPFTQGGHITLDEQRFELRQMHFHAPSEHSIDGELADAELHLMHKNPQGERVVVSLLIRQGAANPVLATLLTLAPDNQSELRDTQTTIDPSNLLPAQQTSYRYTGSLTIPPCSEGVRWVVMTEPLEISPAQLATLARTIPGNNRPVQPLNDRPLVRDSSP